MTRAGILMLCIMSVMATGDARAASTPRQDDLIAAYFAIWDRDSNVTAANVARLYAPSLTYYGHPMTRAALLDDKRAFVRRWPQRHYAVEPGSASKRCDADGEACELSATLLWQTRGPSGVRAGRSRIHLDLAKSDGSLKIVREGAVTLSR